MGLKLLRSLYADGNTIKYSLENICYNLTFISTIKAVENY